MRPGTHVHWSAYPSLLVAGAFAFGIALGHLGGPGSVGSWIGGTAVGLAVFAGADWWDRRRMVTLGPLGRVVGLVILVVCAGAARHAAYQTPSPRALKPVVEPLEDKTSVRGVVTGAPERSDVDTRFTVAVDRVETKRAAIRVEGQVRVTLRPSPWTDRPVAFPRVEQGDSVRLRGTLRPAPDQRNPGGFDYAAYLARRGTCCTMYVGDPADMDIRPRTDRGTVDLVVAGRRYLETQIHRYVPSDGGQAVLQALLLGDRGRITDAQRDDFARTGLMHLLAVSGLHVFLVGMVFYVLLRPLLMRFQFPWRAMEVGRAALTVVLLGFYMVLTGARPSVVRAVVMATLFIGSVVLQRSSHPLNTLGVAALILLAARPAALFDVGFQLSMAAVAGIITLQPRLSPISSGTQASVGVDYAVSVVVTTAAAVLATAPVLLYHFGWVSVAGLLLNVAGIPCTALGLAAALAMGTIGAVSTVAAGAFGSAADLLMQGLLLTSRHGADWLSWAGIRMARPSFLVLGALTLAIVSLAQWPRPRIRWRCVVGSLLLATVAVWGGVLNRAPALDVIFFDVGNGNATLVSTPLDRHILIDTGPRSPTGSAAAYSVLPYLEQQGIRELDAVVVSHPDDDHLGGLPTILREVSVENVFHSGQSTDTELYEESHQLLTDQEIPNRPVKRGDVLSFGAGIHAQILGPPDPEAFDSQNNRSVVLRLTYGGTSILLPGDIEAPAEETLTQAYGRQLRSDVVAVPHHGSKTSSTEAFVKAVVNREETHAVVSVGDQNQYGMPHAKAMAGWREEAAQVCLTADRGAVWIRSDGQDVWQVHWK
ncbi:MAG: DNA internalization-related competence protein ComEC/Rec2 [Salinibacter sp.]